MFKMMPMITDAVATNKFVNHTESNIISNNAEKNNTKQDVEKNTAQDSLCNPITSPEAERLEENISLKLHINQTSQTAKNNRVLEDCKNEDCKAESTKTNPNENTILKFVYKKTNKKKLGNKTQGHSKNSITRRKRSIEIEPTFYKRDSSVPYPTSHEVRNTGGFNLLKDKSEETIKKGDLADFNIETLHKDSTLPKNIEKIDYNAAHSNIGSSKTPRPIKDDIRRYEPQRYDSVEDRKNTYKPSDKNFKESDESNESIYSDTHKSTRSNPIAYGQVPKPPHIKQVPISEIKKKPNKGHVAYSENLNSKEVPNDENYESPQSLPYDANPNIPYSGKIIYDESHKSPRSKETLNIENHKKPHSGHKHYDEHHKPIPSKHAPYSENRSAPQSGETQKIYDSNEYRGDLRKEHKDKGKIDEHSKIIHTDSFGKNNYVPTKDHSEDSYLKEASYEDNKSIENSSERPLYRTTKTNKNDSYKNKPDNTITPRPIQDVDLGDFSYERIQVNDKGKVEPIKDLNDNYDSIELIESTTVASKLISDKNSQLYAPHTVLVNSSVDKDFTKSYQPLAKISNVEVKPVVEPSNENNNSESSEDVSSELQSSNLQKKENYGSSEENQSHIKGTQNKLIAFNGSNGEKGNVKEQFERIPLDYNHNDKSESQTEKAYQPEVSKDNSDENINDGTLDSLAPTTERYDENLKIKFGDVSIKLPEIKLPDDILSYARIGAPKEGEKSSFYQYGDEDSEENPINLRTGAYKNHDFDTIYNSYKDNDHDNYKKPTLDDEDDDDDDVDLYEKFVKERFGKETAFGKKAEKLQAPDNKPLNSKLLENVRKILKKTEQVQNDAEKSGDPNAGYMWTLEYGEDL